jgi:hypothetical protein
LLGVVILNDRLCENTVHGSTKLTTNGVVLLEFDYLSVRPERRRRAPIEFLHSLALSMTFFDSWRRTKKIGTSSTLPPAFKEFDLCYGLRISIFEFHIIAQLITAIP